MIWLFKRLYCKHKSMQFVGVTEWKVIEHNHHIKKEIRYERYQCLDCKKEIKRPEIKENGKVMQKK